MDAIWAELDPVIEYLDNEADLARPEAVRDALTARFSGKAFMPDAPIMSVARGLYKLGLMKENRKRRRSRTG